MPGDKAPPLGGPMGAVLGVLLRNYGFTDLPPSLPLAARSDPVTRITRIKLPPVYKVIRFRTPSRGQHATQESSPNASTMLKLLKASENI